VVVLPVDVEEDEVVVVVVLAAAAAAEVVEGKLKALASPEPL
jgi:hypothetical protein